MEIERRVVRGDEDRIARGGVRVVRPVLESRPREERRVRDGALAVEHRRLLRERPEPAADGDEGERNGDSRQEEPGGPHVSEWSSLREDQYTMPPMMITDKTVTARSTTATAIASCCARPKPSVST